MSFSSINHVPSSGSSGKTFPLGAAAGLAVAGIAYIANRVFGSSPKPPAPPVPIDRSQIPAAQPDARLLSRIDELQQSNSELANQLRTAQSGFETERDDLQSRFDMFKDSVRSLREKDQATIRDLQSSVERLLNENDTLTREKSELVGELDQQTESYKAQRGELLTLHAAALESLNTTVTQLRADLTSAQSQIKDLLQENALLGADNTQLSEKYVSYLHQTMDLTKQLDALQLDITGKKQVIEDLTATNDKLVQREDVHAQTVKDLAGASETIQQLQVDNQYYQGEYNSMLSQYSAGKMETRRLPAMTREIASLTDEVTSLKEENESLQADNDTLKETGSRVILELQRDNQHLQSQNSYAIHELETRVNDLVEENLQLKASLELNK